MRTTAIATGEYYHVYNRGVDRRVIFQSDRDYERFLASLHEFNTIDLVGHLTRKTNSVVAEGRQDKGRQSRLVDIVAFCLMPNHFHLLLKQVLDGGLSKYLHKLQAGYTKYFNLKYERSGVLFQGPFQAKHVSNDNYLLHLSRYIHLNPLGFYEHNWKEVGIGDVARANQSLSAYKWSSYQYYLDPIDSFRPEVDPNIVLGQFSSEKTYRDFVLSWAAKDFTLLNKAGLLFDVVAEGRQK